MDHGRLPKISGASHLMADTTLSIFDLAYSCKDLFCRSTSEVRLASAWSRLEELHQRFNAWTSYLGVLAPSHASLDHRLRFSSEVRFMVVELLLLLQRNLSTVLDAGTTDLTTPLKSLKGGVDRLYQVGVAIRKSSTVGLSSRIQAFSDKHDDEDYFFSLAAEILKRRFPDADTAICAHLAATIKFRRQHIRYQRRHQTKLQYTDRIAAEQPSHTPVAPFSPHSGNLGDSQGVKIVVQAPSQTSASTFLDRDFLRHLNAPPSVPSDAQGHEPLTSPSVISTGSTVLEYGNLPFPRAPDVQGATPASCAWCFQEHTPEQFNDRRWWRRHVLSCLKPFACLSEECKEPPELFSSEADWTRHMTEAHGGGWAQEVYKPIQWFCDIDHPETLYFPHDVDLAQHLRKKHSGTFNETQIPTVLSQNTLSVPRDRHVCPLCNCVPDRLGRLIKANANFEAITPRIPKLITSLTTVASGGNNAGSGPEPFRATRFAGENLPDEEAASASSFRGNASTKFSFTKELEKHIARHLRAVAFISIRNLASEDDASSNASARGQRDSRKSSLRTDDQEASESSLLVFEDIPPDDREPAQDPTEDESHLWPETRANARPTPSIGIESTRAVDESAKDGEAERRLRSVLLQAKGTSLQQAADTMPVGQPSRISSVSEMAMRPTLPRAPRPTVGELVRGAVGRVVGTFWEPEREIDVTVVGLQGCGKTSLLRVLSGSEFTIDSIPTIGFNMKKVQRGRTTIKFWDLGGQPRFRPLWERYCRGVKGIIFVVDISDRELMPLAKEELHVLMGHPTLAGIPLLVLGNHCSRPDRLSLDELIEALSLPEIPERSISCYGIDAKEETNLEAVMMWIMAR